MTTSKDIARIAGVSRTTVSRVLNGATHVSPEAYERVLAAINATGYAPDVTAQNLVRRSSQTVALGLFPEDDGIASANPGWYYFYFDVVNHIEREATRASFDLLLPSRSQGNFQNYVHLLRTRRAAGVVMVAFHQPDTRLQLLLRSDIPAVFIDTLAQGSHATYVKSNNVAGARLAIEYLLELGHTRITLLGGWTSTLSGMERLFGWQQALGDAGITIDPGLVRQTGFVAQEAYVEMNRLLNERHDFTAVVAGSDLMALGVLRALHEHGLRVPEDVSVIGFDDIDLCLFTHPLLTTVHQDRQAMGQGAIHKLREMIDGGSNVAPLIIPTRLIVRASTGPAPRHS